MTLIEIQWFDYTEELTQEQILGLEKLPEYKWDGFNLIESPVLSNWVYWGDMVDAISLDRIMAVNILPVSKWDGFNLKQHPELSNGGTWGDNIEVVLDSGLDFGGVLSKRIWDHSSITLRDTPDLQDSYVDWGDDLPGSLITTITAFNSKVGTFYQAFDFINIWNLDEHITNPYLVFDSRYIPVGKVNIQVDGVNYEADLYQGGLGFAVEISIDDKIYSIPLRYEGEWEMYIEGLVYPTRGIKITPV